MSFNINCTVLSACLFSQVKILGKTSHGQPGCCMMIPMWKRYHAVKRTHANSAHAWSCVGCMLRYSHVLVITWWINHSNARQCHRPLKHWTMDPTTSPWSSPSPPPPDIGMDGLCPGIGKGGGRTPTWGPHFGFAVRMLSHTLRRMTGRHISCSPLPGRDFAKAACVQPWWFDLEPEPEDQSLNNQPIACFIRFSEQDAAQQLMWYCSGVWLTHRRLTVSRRFVRWTPAGGKCFWPTPAVLARILFWREATLRQINQDQSNVKRILADMSLFSAQWCSDRDKSGECGP